MYTQTFWPSAIFYIDGPNVDLCPFLYHRPTVQSYKHISESKPTEYTLLGFSVDLFMMAGLLS